MPSAGRCALGDIWGGLFQVGLFVVPAVGLGLFVWLVIRSAGGRRCKSGTPGPRPVATAGPGGKGPPTELTPAERRCAGRTALAIIVSALCMPWMVGLAVKAYLDAIGEPTYPVSSFLDPAAIAILLTATVIQWCWPCVVLAIWVRSRYFVHFARNRSFRQRIHIAWLTHLGGLLAGAVLFIPVFREWDTMYIFVPLGCFLVPPMLAGYGAGMLIIGRSSKRRDVPGAVG